MPPMHMLSNVDMSGFAPVQPAQNGPESPPDIPSYMGYVDQINNPNRSPFMHASMPLAASTNDALGRQFYFSSNVPIYRVLPAKRGSDT